jgi:hypothetical protein
MGVRLTQSAERVSLSLLAFLVVFAAVAFVVPVLGDGDSWWHLGAGRWIVEYLAIPDTDPFSHSRPGNPWHAHEWGAEVLMWLAYRWGGLAGVIALVGLAAGASAGLLASFVKRHLAPWPAMLVTMVAVLCLLPSALARPHLIALPILVAWLAAMLRAREAGRPPPLPLTVLMVVWANLHGSFLLGLALIVPLALEAVIAAEDRRSALGAWSKFGLVSIAASFATPFGLTAYWFPLQIASMDSLQHIQEWRPSTIGDDPLFFGVVLATIAMFLALGVRFPPLRALIFVGLLFMALSHARHQFVFAFLGWLVAAEPLGSALAGRRARRTAEASMTDRRVMVGLMAACGLAVLVRLAIPAGLEERHRLPLAIIARVPPELRQAPVFNEYSFGGPLVFSGIRPFIDGRADMYGDAFVREYLDAARGSTEAWRRIAGRHDIRWTILPPGSPLIGELERSGWRRILADERAVIHLGPATAGTVSTGEERIRVAR